MDNHSSDARAAFTGLIVGAVVLFSLMFGIVQLVNASYKSSPDAAHTPH